MLLNLYIDSSIARVKNILHKIVGDFPPTVVTGCLVDSALPLPNKNNKLLVTFNDLEGQIHIAYDTYGPNRSMHAKNQVNQCSG